MAPTDQDITVENLPPFKLPSESQLTDLNHLSCLLHLLHHRNHNQHRRSTWYRHFNIFRRQFSSLLHSISSLQETPTTNLARHRKKVTDKKTEVEIRQRLGFWRDVLVPKVQHAFGQVLADGRFAVLGVMLLASLGSICKILGLVGVYEEMGQKEVERVLEEFAREGWGEDEGLGVLVPRSEVSEAGNEDMGEILGRREDEDVDDEGSAVDLEEIRRTEKEFKKRESACLAPERDILRQSRDAVREMSKASVSASPAPQGPLTKKMRKPLTKEKLNASPSPLLDDLPTKNKKTKRTEVENPLLDDLSKSKTKAKKADDLPMSKTNTQSLNDPLELKTKTKTKRAKIDDSLAVSKPAKKRRKRNAIDDLFSGL